MGRRHFMIAIGGLVIAGVGVRALVKWATGPMLYPGDRLEERTCPGCGGKGCEMCRGAGKVQVIVPGPKRPVRIRGDVFEGKVRHPGGKNWHITWMRTPRTRAGTPMPGFVAGAQVRISGMGETLDLVTDENGRFDTKLLPGKYRLAVTASGFDPLDQEIDVSFGGDIWVPEPPTDYPNPRDPSSRRITYGSGTQDLGVGLTRR